MSQFENQFFRRALENAKEIFSSRESVLKTLDSALRKVINLESEKEEVTSLTAKVKLFILMIRSYMTGEYRDMPARTIILIIAGLIYFINPFDLIGDFIPGIGYIDDITIIWWILKSIEEDVLRFKRNFMSLSDS